MDILRRHKVTATYVPHPVFLYMIRITIGYLTTS